MKFFIRTACIILSTLTLLLGVGCTKEYQKAIVYFLLDEVPSSLDPQIASSDAELMIVSNVFEGLLRKNSEGKIVNAAAENVKKEGLTYTFKLRDNLKWSNGEKLTAKDFAFGLRRAVDKKTEAKFAYKLLSIKNAEEINRGEASLDSLGVKARDDKTLEITLEFEDEFFLDALTCPIAMPCNEKFFGESGGQYGLESKYLLSNGSYYLARWNKERFGIRIYKNEEYSGDFAPENGGVFFSITPEEKTTYEVLKDNDADLAFVTNNDLESLKNEGFKTASVENICWVLTVGNEYPDTVKNAIIKSTSGSVFEKNLKSGFRTADSVYPNAVNDNLVGNQNLTDYDLDTAKNLFRSVLSTFDDKKFPTTTLYYYDNSDFKSAVTAIVAHWQNNLSAFINIKGEASYSEFEGEITNKTKPFAIFPIEVTSGDAREYLKYFGIRENNLSSAQSEIFADNSVIPLAFETTDIVYNPELENVTAKNGNGYIDFSYVIKK